ncbi:iron-siderophore ABC transporter substrate-binding protein [Mycobacterium sp. 2YAF39]|uniref:iron-siderophore ABC transporter substrate-binding protein n=1 Tax=Mycobacterium sp. 2YAF39 TaxID=3233033 RepID=UPI003F9ABA97
MSGRKLNVASPPARRAGLLASSTAIAAALAITVVSGCGSLGGETSPPEGQKAPVTSTTKIANAGVLGNQRRPDESCAPEPAPVDPGQPDRPVTHAAGETVVRADPQRIVVLSGDQLDTLCALGLQSRVVAAAVPDGSDSQPSYLGTVIHDVPSAGSRSAPDIDAIKAATPDLILGSQALTPDDFGELSAIAPTVFTGPPGARWQDNTRTVGAATGRLDAANEMIDGFERAADKTGAENDATHFQASVVQFTETAMRVYGPDNFPGSVLAAVGVDRPASQRFTDKPYIEIGITDTDLDNSPDFSAADGDIIYISFDSPAAKDRAPRILESDAWKKLSANRDNRIFAVNNEVWQTGEGIVAARGILADLPWINAPIN